VIFKELLKNGQFEVPYAGYRVAPFLAHSNRYNFVVSKYFSVLFSVMNS
jgi:hypothetical protein